MRKVFLLIVIGLLLWTVISPVGQEATPTIWSAVGTGPVDSLKMGGYNRIIFICNVSQMTSLSLVIEGARAFGIGEWGNLDSNDDSLIVTPSSVIDSTFVMAYNGYIPCFRLNVRAMSGATESLFVKVIRFNEGDM